MNCFIETLSLTRSLLPGNLECRVADESMLPLSGSTPDFQGNQTNISPTKYYFWYLTQKREILDRVVVVTDDICLEEKEEALGGRTTYDYYLDEIKAYLKELSDSNAFFSETIGRRWGSVTEYVDAIFMPVRISKQTEAKKWSEVVWQITGNVVEGDSIDLYFDFTGGSRVASLISLLLLKVIEVGSAKVQRVIYVEKSGLEKIITDCTESYGILTSIERIAMARASQDNPTTQLVQELKELGLAKESDLAGMAIIDKLRKKDQLSLSRDEAKAIQKSGEEFRHDFNASNSLIREVGSVAVENLRRSSGRSAFRKLSEDRKQAAKLILDFHEAIMMVLIDNEILRYVGQSSLDTRRQKELILNALKANDNYYSCYYTVKGRQVERGVISEVHRWLRSVRDNPRFTAEKTMAHYLNVSLVEYDRAIWKMRLIKGFTGPLTQAFDKYLEGVPLSVRDSRGTDRVSWQRVYYNYGFPFACMAPGGSTDVFSEIQEYYLNSALSLMESLDKLRELHSGKYTDELDQLLRDRSELERRLPYMTRFSFLEVSKEKFASGEDEQFLQTLCARLEEVRPYRNAIAHKIKNRYSEPESQEEEAKRIRAWLEEYDLKFFPQS